nr:putative esterase/lipase [Quercus suber]
MEASSPLGQYQTVPYNLDAGPLGYIEGLMLSGHSRSRPACYYFGGLPYALPPIGSYRFRPPRPLPDAYHYGTKANPGRFTGSAATCPQPWPASKKALWSEDCLQLNIYIPAGRSPPKSGWPVFFYIHGGYLQWGDPNMPPSSLASLLGETAFKAIIVAPAYRLNALGFLASQELQAEAIQNGETCGNMGFWDQRLALDWVAKNICYFSGDSDNITVGGYSAGAHSTYQQLAHELYLVPDDKAIIKRIIMWSNSPGVQPKTLVDHQKQTDELLAALGIPLTLNPLEKLRRLRAVNAEEIVSVQDNMKWSEFRALTDGAFVPEHVIANINSGDFGRRMKARGIQIMNGECRDEHFSYQSWRTPKNSYNACYNRLCADYPTAVVTSVMDRYCGPSRRLPANMIDWADLFGRIYANMQVHCLERGFAHCLSKGGLQPGIDILRYRIDWRAKCVDRSIPPEWLVTHATDLAVWLWGGTYGTLANNEQEICRPFNEAFAAFVRDGDVAAWSHVTSLRHMKRLRSDGQTDVFEDDRWEERDLWNVVNSDAAYAVPKHHPGFTTHVEGIMEASSPLGQYQTVPYNLDAGPLGYIEGLMLSGHSRSRPACYYFGGLPYALPPIGSYRFRPPRPLPDAYHYGTKANPGRFTGSAATCPQPWPASKKALWSEDCLQLNIYIPAGRSPPKSGWPVFFYIHGGYLQWGDPNMPPSSLASLLGETAFKAIIVAPAYRLNALGFLASQELQAEAIQNGETCGNMGFWDQRLALDWVAKNICYFSGDSDNITVGGYSAGAHSTYQQLAHELYLVPDDKAIIKRIIMWSNSPGVQPKTLVDHQKQTDELLAALGIPLTLNPLEKLRRLRAVNAEEIVSVQDNMKWSEFRALTDGAFVPEHVIANINSGDFGRRMKARGIQIMNGECRDEHFSYQSWRTPKNSYNACYNRLCADYPTAVVTSVMDRYCGPSRRLPANMIDWADLFGRIYANMQVHCLERGFAHCLSKGGLQPGIDILRYRIDWRAKCVDRSIPPEWLVTHATDLAVWLWGGTYGTLANNEQEICRPFNEAFAAFVRDGDVAAWSHVTSLRHMKRLRSDGQTDVFEDDRWEERDLWNVVNSDAAYAIAAAHAKAKL